MQLLEAAPQDAAADPLLVAGALATLAETADGIGPPIGRVLDAEGRPTGLVAAAHDVNFVMHPYTFRIDRLPVFAGSADAALHGLFATAAIDGLLSFRPPAQRAS